VFVLARNRVNFGRYVYQDNNIIMLRLSETQKNITIKLLAKEIKSVNDFCKLFFEYTILFSPIDKRYEDYENIFIYDENNYAFKIAKDFRFLIQYYIKHKYIKTIKDYSLSRCIPYWSFDTPDYFIFHALNECCKEFGQKNFIVKKRIRLKILILLNKLLKKRDFKIIKFKAIFIQLKKLFKDKMKYTNK